MNISKNISKTEMEIRRLSVESARRMNLFGAIPLKEENEIYFEKYIVGELEYEDLIKTVIELAKGN